MTRTPVETSEALYNALQVMLTDGHIHAWLLANDPKALEQAREAAADYEELAYGEVTPRCDYCHLPDLDGDWNGETGNHRTCEASAYAKSVTDIWNANRNI